MRSLCVERKTNMKIIMMIAIACMTMVCSASSSITNTNIPIKERLKLQEYETYIIILDTMSGKLKIELTNLEQKTEIKTRKDIKQIDSIVKQINQIENESRAISNHHSNIMNKYDKSKFKSSYWTVNRQHLDSGIKRAKKEQKKNLINKKKMTGK